MAEQKESSVLFSLKELMNLEEDRIRQEEEDKHKKLRAEEDARLDAERRTREAEEARLRGEEERRRQEEYRARQEAAALEAQRQAAIESARVQAENIARMEAMRHQQEHERQLTHIKESSGKKQFAAIAGGIGALLVIGGVVTGIVVYKQNQKAEAERRLAQEEKDRLQGEIDKLNREKKEADEAVAKLEDAVKKAGSEADKAKAIAALEEAKNRQAQTTRNLGAVRGGGTVAPDRPKKQVCKQTNGTVVPSCPEGDPLCSCQME